MVALIGVSNEWHWLLDLFWATWWGFKAPYWTTIAIAIVISAAGLVWAPIKTTLGRARAEAEMLTAFKETLVPSARKLIANTSPTSRECADIAESIMDDLRAYVAPKGTTGDANFYLLEKAASGEASLIRVNKSYKQARLRFDQLRRPTLSPDQVEEGAVVERVLAFRQARCTNVRRKRLQRLFRLNPERQRDYVAFMTVPVLSTDRRNVIGMLSINSGNKNVLQKFHFDYLNMVAQLLAEFHQVRPFRSLAGHTGPVASKSKRRRGKR